MTGTRAHHSRGVAETEAIANHKLDPASLRETSEVASIPTVAVADPVVNDSANGEVRST